MKKWIIVMIITAFCLSACGVKGELYFPEDDKTQTKLIK